MDKKIPLNSPYRYYAFQNGFTIYALHRRPVQVQLMHGRPVFGIWRLPRRVDPRKPFNYSSAPERMINFYHFGDLVRALSNLLLDEFRWIDTQKQMEREVDTKKNTRPGWMHEWLSSITRRAIGKPVSALWSDLRQQQDPLFLDLSKKIYSLNPTNKNLPEAARELLFCDKNQYSYFLADCLKYRGALTSLLLLDEKLADICATSMQRSQLWNSGEITRWVSNWRSLYAGVYGPNKSLNITVDHLPGGIPPNLVLHFPHIQFTQPVADRKKLISLLYLGIENCGFGPASEIVFRSTPDQVERALRRVMRHFHIPTDMRSVKNIQAALGFIKDLRTDQPLQQGTMVALADRTIDYHTHEVARETERLKKQAERLKNAKTALPPIPLPVDPEIRFLSTPMEVIEEGGLMGHCVASYHENAVKGQCYLFHIEKDGEMATAEVAPNGTVVQVYGPQNRQNKASEFGKKALRRWGRKLRDAPALTV